MIVAILIGSVSYVAAIETSITIPVETTIITPDITECPTGQYLQGFDMLGGLLCQPLPNGSGGSMVIGECEPGYYLKGFDNNGGMICQPFPSGSGNMVIGECEPGYYLKGFDDNGDMVCEILSSNAYFENDGYNTINLARDSQFKYFSLGDLTPASEFVNDCNRFAADAQCGTETKAKLGQSSAYFWAEGDTPGRELRYSLIQHPSGEFTFTKQGDFEGSDIDRTDILITQTGDVYFYGNMYAKNSAGTWVKLN